MLFSSHEFFDLIMAADKEKGYFIRKFKQNSVLESSPDFPIVAVPIFQAEAGRQWGVAVQVLHECVNGLVNLLLTGGGKFFETAVKAGLKFVSHFTSSGVLNACEQPQSHRSGCRALFSIDQVWRPAFCNRRD